MKTFKKILLAFSCLLSLFLMVGCSTLTEEEKEEQRKLKTEYEMIGKEYIQNSLKDKYGQDFEVYNIKVKQSKGSFFHTSSGKYIPSMSAKASYNNQEIDVLLIYDEMIDISKLNDSISYLFNNTIELPTT